MSSLLSFLNSDNYRVYNVQIAKKLGSVNAAIMLSEIVQRYEYHANENQLEVLRNHDGEWFYYTIDKCEERTGLSRDQQDPAIDILIKLDFIKKTISGSPPKRFFQINENKIIESLIDSKNVSNLRKIHKSICGKSTNQFEENPQNYKEPKSKNISKKDLGMQTEIVHKMKPKTLDATRRWKLSPTQHETYLSLQGLDIRDGKGNPLEEKKLAYWAKNYSLDRMLDVYHEAKRYIPRCMKAYMSKLLDENKKVVNSNAEANEQFTVDFLESNSWQGLQIFKQYIKYPLGADFGEIDLNMNPVDFATRFIEKYEQSRER